MYRSIVSLCVGMAVAAMLPASVDAAAISVSLYSANQLGASDVAGIVPVTNWNNLGVDSLSALKDNSGAATTASISVSGGTYKDGGVTWSLATDTPDAKMMADGRGDFSSPGSVVISLTAIPYPEYALYVYVNKALGEKSWIDTSVNGGPTVYTNVVTYRHKNAGWAPDKFDQSMATTVGGRDDGNYVIISGLTVANATVTSAFSAPVGSMPWGSVVSGIQIVAVPEPATLGLLALGVGALTTRRSRR